MTTTALPRWPCPATLKRQLRRLMKRHRRGPYGLDFRSERVVAEDGEPETEHITITETVPYIFGGPMNPLPAGMATISPFEMECTSLSPDYTWRQFLRGRKKKAELSMIARLVSSKAGATRRNMARLADLKREHIDRQTSIIRNERGR